MTPDTVGNRWRVIYRATVRAETPRPPNGPDPIPDVWVVERYAWGRWRPLCQHTRHRDAMLCADQRARRLATRCTADRDQRDYGLVSP